MRGAIPVLPNTPSWRGAQLKHRDKFTSYPICASIFTDNYIKKRGIGRRTEKQGATVML
jgi:hypothetical protein